MSWCSFRSVQVTGVADIDFGISDLEWHTTANGTFLYAMSGPSGGITVYEVIEGQGLAMVDQTLFPGSYARLDGASISITEIDGKSYLVAGKSGGDFLAYEIKANGELGNATSLIPNAPTNDVSGVLELDGIVYVFGETLDHYTVDTSTDSQHEGSLVADIGGDISDALTVEHNGASYVVVASAEGNEVAVYRVDDVSGDLTYTGGTGARFGLGLNGITGLDTVTVAGETYVVVAASGTDSISVLKIDDNGGLSPVEHLLDSTSSRFENVTSIETVTVDGRVYVLAGGGDDGINLFTMLPDGRLVHLEAIADTTVLGFDTIQDISAVVIGDEIQVFVVSQADGGITQMVISTDDIGMTWKGSLGNDTQSGTSGDDILDGSWGHDVLSGGAGDDILVDGYGQDTLTGGAGADIFVLSYDGETDTITDFKAGVDQLDLTAFFLLYDVSQLQVISTTWGATLTYHDETIHIYSDNGTPLTSAAIFGAGFTGPTRPPMVVNSQITGGEDGDLLEGGTGDDMILGQGGDDVVTAGDGDDLVLGGAGNDTLTGDAGDDTIDGEQGDDVIRGSNGDDTLSGAAGADTIYGGSGNDIVYGGAGDDHLEGGGGNDVLTGNGGDDVILGGGGHDDIIAGAGNDTVYGGTGNDTVSLGDGNDIFDATGETESDVVLGGDGADQITGGDGADTLSGGNDNDVIIGGNGADHLEGDEGADTLLGGAGLDVILGGIGNDTIDGGGSGDTLYGNAGNDIISGGGGDDEIWGGQGKDTVYGDAGSDTVYLGAGNDTFDATGETEGDTVFGESGVDTITGGAGDDVFSGDAGHDIISGGDGADSLSGGNGNDDLRGGNDRDTIYGGGGKDVLYGDDGGDFIFGDEGSDTIFGGAGSDDISGGSGIDVLDGGAGQDSLAGGAGDDTLTGGAGADVFSFTDQAGTDTITDFTIGEDIIQIDVAGIDRKGHLIFSQTDQGLAIDFGSGSVILAGITASTLSADNFDFI